MLRLMVKMIRESEGESSGGSYMKADTAKFTLRTDLDLLKKFHFIADYNGRSSNRELEVLFCTFS